VIKRGGTWRKSSPYFMKKGKGIPLRFGQDGGKYVTAAPKHGKGELKGGTSVTRRGKGGAAANAAKGEKKEMKRTST